MTNLDEAGSVDGAAIAIIGMAGRFPGAADLEMFWQNLRAGVESITAASDEELHAAGIDPEALRASGMVNAAARIEGIDLFDAAFFGYSPKEAEVMDPQQRIFLECAWETLEQAGYDAERYSGLIGLYAGIGLNTYLLQLLSALDRAGAVDGLQVTIGNDKDYLTTRASYKLNLRGPSVCVQTACSTSLVAVHLACQALISYECDMALAGGVSIRAPQPLTYAYQEGSILSPDGHCRAFDQQSQGTIFGNGIGLVLLKRLPEAIADGDTIYAVIKGSAINNDGAAKVGYTAPSMQGQAAVIRTALGVADVAPETIGYIEAHGTGTALGDPIEVAALTRVFRATTAQEQFCALGSVKTNIGHLDTAAGVAALIKAVLALKHQQIPPSLHFERPNPQIDLARSPFYVNTRLADWPRNGVPRRAGVSAFGIGGTNAHVVLEEAPALSPSDPARPWQLLVLSARTSAALAATSAQLLSYLEAHADANLADVAYTLQVGRRPFAVRRALVCRDVSDASAQLAQADSSALLTAESQAEPPAVVFMFTGQGAQYPNMGRELYEHEPVFREQIDRCAALLRPMLGRDLRELLYPDATQLAAASEELSQTCWTQPALFMVEYALAKLWIAWGIQPEAMIGHSIGEYVAACLAGVFSLEEALAIIAQRGQLMHQLPAGDMLAVSLPEAELLALLDGSLALAAVNAPSLCVVSGPSAEVQALHQRLREQQVHCQRLHTSHAFHSAMMDPILGRFSQALSRIRLHEPQIPYISNLTGDWIAAGEATDPAYWTHHLRQTVRFDAGLQQLLRKPNLLLLEVGPGQTLGKIARQPRGNTAPPQVLNSLPSVEQTQPARACVLTALGKLWLANVPIRWPALHSQQRRQRIALPTYPFERQRYWVDGPGGLDAVGAQLKQDGKRRPMEDWLYTACWRQALPARALGQRAYQPHSECWLLFGDAHGLGEQLAQLLHAAGEPTIMIYPGETFARLDQRTYTIDPQQAGDYERLLKEVQQAGAAPHTIVHLWSITAHATPLDLDTAIAAQRVGLDSLLFVAQALGKRTNPTPVRIDVLTNDLYSVIGVEQLRPEKATLLGPRIVIPQEYPELACRCIDIELPAVGSPQTPRIIQQLIDELKADAPDEDVAYRGLQRWTQRFEPVKLPSAAERGSRLREGGVYLITGGLGGLGLALAEYLGRTYHAKLVLVSRTGLGPAASEQSAASAPAREPNDETIERLRALESLGAEVLTIRADVTRPEEMQAVLDTIQARFGALNGVFHLAGVAGGGVIQLKTRDVVESVLAPKMLGALALDQVLADTPLDFMVLFSSITAVTGGLGQVEYCAANAFLDAFAHYRTARGAPTAAIDWDAWQWDTWQTASLAALPDVQAQFKRLREQYGINFAEGHAVLETLVSHLLPHLIVSTRDLHVTIADHRRFAQAVWRTGGAAVRASSGHARPLPAETYVAPQNDVEQIIAEIWQEALGLDRVGVHDDFIELGGHSLLAIQVVSRLRETFTIELSLRSLFEHNTVARLATAVTTIILEEIEGLSQDQVQDQLT